MTSRKPGRLAIHRRSDEIAFLQHRLRVLGEAEGSHAVDVAGEGQGLELNVLARERDLADELLHTRQIEPLGETLQRRLAMAERICQDLRRRSTDGKSDPQALDVDDAWRGQRERFPESYWVVEIERRALGEMLDQWWAWLS